MKQLKYKFWAKVTALTLLPIFAMLAFFGTIGTVYLVDMEAFADEGRGLRQEINEGMIREKMNEIMAHGAQMVYHLRYIDFVYRLYYSVLSLNNHL